MHSPTQRVHRTDIYIIECKHNKKEIEWLQHLFINNNKIDMMRFSKEVHVFLEMVENAYNQRQIRGVQIM